jgi:hypothetical protein
MRMTTGEELSSSDARDAILSCHDELRGLANETIHCAEDATRSDRDFEPLCAHARELYQAFEEYIDFEERILATALSDVIGCGSMLHAQIEAGHRRQRATLASTMSSLGPGAQPHARVIETVRAVADALLVDLRSEEDCLLSAEIDAIALEDFEGG